MNLHKDYRWPNRFRRTHPRQMRAFTIMELVGAMAMFMLTVALLTGAAAVTLNALGGLDRTGRLNAAIDGAVDVVAATPWGTLVTNTFTPPDLCPGQPTEAGTTTNSCLSVGNRSYVITWTVAQSGASDVATITATTTRWDGLVSSRTRTVARTADASTVGTLRVNIDGVSAGVTLLLLGGADFDEILDGAVGDGASATLYADPSSCTTASPCRIGLQAGTQRGLTEQHTLDPETVVGDSGLIVLAGGGVQHTAVTVSERTRTQLVVQAQNQTSLRRLISGDVGDVAPHPNSLCVWVSASGGQLAGLQPFCNSDNDGRIINLDTFTPDPGQPDVVVGVPAGIELTLHVDHPDGCPVVAGQTYFSGGAWNTVTTDGVCSSWTWGRPDQLVVPGSDNLDLTGGQAVVDQSTLGAHQMILAYGSVSPDRSRPAAGFANEPVFAKPRQAELCPGWGVDGCEPPVDTPELDGACATHCFSNAAPPPHLRRLTDSTGTTTVNWPYSWPTPANTTQSFRTQLNVPTGTAAVTLTSLPDSTEGTLSFCPAGCAAVTADQVLAAAAGDGTQLAFQWQAASGSTGSYFEITLDSPSGQRTERIYLPTAPTTAVAIDVFETRAQQGGTATLNAQLYDTSGAVVSGAAVDFGDGPDGMVPDSGQFLSGSDGFAFGDVVFSTTPAGPSLVSGSVSGRTFEWFVEVTGAAAGVDGAAVNIAQGETETAEFVVVDRSGEPLPGVVVAAEVLFDGAATRFAAISPRWCVTEPDGACDLPVTAARFAPAGTYELTVGGAGSSDVLELNITAGIARITGEAPVVYQGEIAPLTLSATDASGQGIEGLTIAIDLPDDLESPFEAVITGPDGSVTFDVTVLGAAQTGQRTIGLTAGTWSGATTLNVRGLPTNVGAAPGALGVARGFMTEFTATAFDINLDPIEAATITAETEPDSGIRVTPKATTGPNGQAVFHVYADLLAAPGVHLIEVTAGTAVPVTVAVTVT